MTSCALAHGTLPQRLFQEWHRLRTQAHVLEHIRSWPLTGDPVHDLSELLVRCGFEGRRDDDDADETLRQLVVLAAHDALAARVVLQRLLPGMLAVAQRRSNGSPGSAEAMLAELVGATWVLIRSYPVGRRPRHVAANLLRDAEYEAFRRPTRLVRHAREVSVSRPTPHRDEFLDPTTAWLEDPRRRLREVLNSGQAAGMHHQDLTLLALLATGESTEALASKLGVSDRTLRARRATAVARLRQVVATA